MTLTTPLEVFLAGLAGGVLLELMHWYSLKQNLELPLYAKRPFYWLVTLLMAVTGGGLSLLYFGGRAEGIVAVHVGISAPLILQKLATTVAATPGAKGSNVTLLSFFKW